MYMTEAIKLVLNLLAKNESRCPSKEGTLFTEVVDLFHDLPKKDAIFKAIWVLAYLSVDRKYCAGVQIKPLNPTPTQRWLLLKWAGRYEMNLWNNFPTEALQEWHEIRWVLSNRWKHRIEEIPLWKKNADNQTDPPIDLKATKYIWK